MESITARVWLNGIRQWGTFVLTRPERLGTDYAFASLDVNGVRYTRSNADELGFSQWVYLVIPGAFDVALEGKRVHDRKKRRNNRGYMRSSHAVFVVDASVGQLRWNLDVNYLVSACCGSGFRVQPRQLTIVFFYVKDTN